MPAGRMRGAIRHSFRSSAGRAVGHRITVGGLTLHIGVWRSAWACPRSRVKHGTAGATSVFPKRSAAPYGVGTPSHNFGTGCLASRVFRSLSCSPPARSTPTRPNKSDMTRAQCEQKITRIVGDILAARTPFAVSELYAFGLIRPRGSGARRLGPGLVHAEPPKELMDRLNREADERGRTLIDRIAGGCPAGEGDAAPEPPPARRGDRQNPQRPHRAGGPDGHEGPRRMNSSSSGQPSGPTGRPTSRPFRSATGRAGSQATTSFHPRWPAARPRMSRR